MPRTQNRLQSTGSSRYQSDPLNHNQQQQRNAMALASTSIDSSASTAKYSIATDDGNYLVPNARGTPSSSSSAVAYTPVVIHENGESGKCYGALITYLVDCRTLPEHPIDRMCT